ncbi:DUF4112 domain-containing protein [Candidatus Halobonum tyrrellensis]|uniref:DUF4112 domain-containing protein n=1 Tax=Candidatus Halobonum tyrrellensis G22 TaxID=1324957 RepID=V4HE80_9EURY|nr:DUF4112 domain-containing protein [Candidatus Halobonum tyrrellensis]ESP88985.1 hypothetical protein K933_06033 [Candidatus Halobonum tyrrellensis G22]
MIDTLRETAGSLSESVDTRLGSDGTDGTGRRSPVGWVRDESASLSRVRTVGYLLDDSLPIPGTDRRIGLDPLIGLLPVAGDTITGLLSLYIVAEGANMGVPRNVIGRMLFNVVVDTLLGFVPVVGDIFDATWKSNQRNVDLIERYAESNEIEAGDTLFDRE